MSKRKLGKKLEIIQVLEKNGFVRDSESIEKYEDGTSSIITLYSANDRNKYVTINVDGKVTFAYERKTTLREIIYLQNEMLTAAYKEAKRGKNNGKN